MKNKKYKILFFSLICSSIILCQSSIMKQHDHYSIPALNTYSQNNLNTNKFLMNHGFSLSTSMGNNQSQSFGIYSNQIQYQISDKFQIKTNIDLIQGKGNFQNINSPETSIQYGLGIEYKLNSNSIISFQIINKNKNISNNIISH